MIDIDALIKNPKRSKNIFHVCRWKIKKTTKNSAKLAQKVRKLSRSRDAFYRKRSTWIQMIGIGALVKTWYKANFIFRYSNEKTRKPVLIGVNERQKRQKTRKAGKK